MVDLIELHYNIFYYLVGILIITLNLPIFILKEKSLPIFMLKEDSFSKKNVKERTRIFFSNKYFDVRTLIELI